MVRSTPKRDSEAGSLCANLMRWAINQLPQPLQYLFARIQRLWIRWILLGICAFAVLLWNTTETWTQWRWVQAVHHAVTRAPLPQAQVFSVALAYLEGDDNDDYREALSDALGDIPGIHRLKFDRRTQVTDAANADLAQAQASKQAKEWLHESGAHVLIWGQVMRVAGGDHLRLHFVAKDAPNTSSLRLSGDQAIELPAVALGQLGAVVRAQVLAQIAPLAMDGNVQAKQLQHQLTVVTPVVQDWADPATRASLSLSLSDSWRIVGEMLGDRDALIQALDLARQALADTPRASAPLDWARAQGTLGSALRVLGEHLDDEVLLRDSVAAYKAALQEYTQARMPQGWAAAQNNLGIVLQFLGERLGNEALLREAVAAYKAALQERSRESAPQKWAMTQNNLGVALATLGEQLGDEALLREAVEAFRAALLEYTRERVPQDWAMTERNLAAVLTRLEESSDSEPTPP